MKILRKSCIFLVLILVGCGDTINGKSTAEPEVVRFHERINSHDFEQIYDVSSADFKKASAKDKILSLFSAIERKLGKLESSKEVNWNVRTFNLTTNVVLVYQSKFQDGDATETFTFQVSDGKAELLGYNISSLDMLIK